MDRTIYIDSNFEDPMAYSFIKQLEFFDAISSEDIYVVIKSYGGSVPALLAMHAAAKAARSDIVMVAVGTVMSAGAFAVLGIGTPGKRLSLPDTQFMLHEARGMAQHSEQGVRPMRHYNDLLFKMMAERFNRPEAEIREELSRDVYLFPEEAIQRGWIDGIVQAPSLSVDL